MKFLVLFTTFCFILPIFGIGIEDACSGQFFIPILIPETISSDQFMKATCQDLDTEFVSPLVCFHECTTEKALRFDDGAKVLKDCWERFAYRSELPVGQQQVINFFCNSTNSWMYKNMVDFCVISKLSDSFTNRTVLDEFRKCPGIRNLPNKYRTPQQKGHLTGFVFPPRKKDLFSPPMTMFEAKTRMKKICQENNQHLLVTEVFENECFLRSHPKQKSKLQDCWSMMIPSLPYPEKIHEWSSFYCNSSNPYSEREGFEFCLMNKYNLFNHPECDRFHLFQKSYHIFRPEIPEADVMRYVNLYQEQSARDSQKSSMVVKKLTESFCSAVPPEGLSETSKLEPQMRHFLRRDPLICLSVSSPREFSPLTNMCFDFVVGSSSNVNEMSDLQWINYLCAIERNGRSIQQVLSDVKSCVSASFSRANEWMKSRKLFTRFKRQLIKGTPTEDFLKIYKSCLN